MTRGDLHDRGAGQPNSEPYGLSIFPSCSIGAERIDAIKAGLTRKTGTGDIEGSLIE
jgi:hypothetical protein